MKLAVICGGRAYKDDPTEKKQLEFIDNSVKDVTKTLRSQGWICEPKRVQSTEDYKSLLVEYKNETIDEYLFYFTGHGFGSNNVEFEIFLETNALTIEQLIKATKSALGYFPKKMALVIDSCYSGMAVEKNYKNIEIVTSTNDRTESFEKKGLYEDNTDYGISVFSYYFCEAFNEPHESEVITLKSIAIHVEESQTKQKPYCSEALERDRVVLGYNKNLNTLKTKIKQHYKNKELSQEEQVNTFKYDILRFYPREKEELYNGIRNSKNMDDLLTVLFTDRSSSYLYCILKFLKIDDDYVHTFKGDNTCVEVNSKVEGIMVVVDTNTAKNAYRADIYRVLDNGKVEESGKIGETTWENLYKNELVGELEKILALNCVAKLELQMVLPISLMKSEFKKEDICVGEMEGMLLNDKWGKTFNITTKFLSRLKGYESEGDNAFSLWNDNLTRYEGCLEVNIEPNVYCPDVVENMSNFCDNNALFLVSENSLIDNENLMKLYFLGIPFMMTAQENKYAFTSHEKYEKWTKSKVKTIRKSSYVFINEMPETLHFLCDDGYSNEFLKVFQNIGKDELRTENYLGDEDYE